MLLQLQLVEGIQAALGQWGGVCVILYLSSRYIRPGGPWPRLRLNSLESLDHLGLQALDEAGDALQGVARIVRV